MTPIAVDVVLVGGYPQCFTQGRSWRITGLNEGGNVEVLDAADNVIAVIAEGRWEAVGYRYTQPDEVKVKPNKSNASWRDMKRAIQSAARIG
jgi:hypothetical protein